MPARKNATGVRGRRASVDDAEGDRDELKVREVGPISEHQVIACLEEGGQITDRKPQTAAKVDAKCVLCIEARDFADVESETADDVGAGRSLAEVRHAVERQVEDPPVVIVLVEAESIEASLDARAKRYVRAPEVQ